MVVLHTVRGRMEATYLVQMTGEEKDRKSKENSKEKRQGRKG
jgi:hypothetical protein